MTDDKLTADAPATTPKTAPKESSPEHRMSVYVEGIGWVHTPLKNPEHGPRQLEAMKRQLDTNVSLINIHGVHVPARRVCGVKIESRQGQKWKTVTP